MKFKIDQNLPLEFEEILAGCGHDAVSVHRQGMNGAPDDAVVRVCHAEDRVLITADLDLSDIRAYPPSQSAGYIVFPLKKQSRPRQIALLKNLLALLDQQPLRGKLLIAEQHRVRVR